MTVKSRPHPTPPEGLGAGYSVYTSDGGELHTMQTLSTVTANGSLYLQKKNEGINFAWAPGQWLRLVWRGR